MRNRLSEAWQGFTLIELLVVVAIIAILASIAVPNMLNAQLRAKVSRMHADMRTLSSAVATYQIDHNNFPYRRNTRATATIEPIVPEQENRMEQMSVLTTPVRYISTIPEDIFDLKIPRPENIIDYYDSTQVSWLINSRFLRRDSRRVTPGTWGGNWSRWGPMAFWGRQGGRSPGRDVYGWPVDPWLEFTIYFPYDPTNGAVSPGNIYFGLQGGADASARFLMERLSRRR